MGLKNKYEFCMVKLKSINDIGNFHITLISHCIIK